MKLFKGFCLLLLFSGFSANDVFSACNQPSKMKVKLFDVSRGLPKIVFDRCVALSTEQLSQPQIYLDLMVIDESEKTRLFMQHFAVGAKDSAENIINLLKKIEIDLDGVNKYKILQDLFDQNKYDLNISLRWVLVEFWAVSIDNSISLVEMFKRPYVDQDGTVTVEPLQLYVDEDGTIKLDKYSVSFNFVFSPKSVS